MLRSWCHANSHAPPQKKCQPLCTPAPNGNMAQTHDRLLCSESVASPYIPLSNSSISATLCNCIPQLPRWVHRPRDSPEDRGNSTPLPCCRRPRRRMSWRGIQQDRGRRCTWYYNITQANAKEEANGSAGHPAAPSPWTTPRYDLRPPKPSKICNRVTL